MIDAQIEQARVRRRERRVQRRRRAWRAIPRALVEDFERLWIVYGESTQATRHGDKQRELVQWTALNPHSGRVFERVVRPALRMPDERHLEHMGLEREAVDGGAHWTSSARVGSVVCGRNGCRVEPEHDRSAATSRP